MSLSDKEYDIFNKKDGFNNSVYHSKDVKQFIKELKEETFEAQINANNKVRMGQIIRYKINELAGDKLI